MGFLTHPQLLNGATARRDVTAHNLYNSNKQATSAGLHLLQPVDGSLFTNYTGQAAARDTMSERRGPGKAMCAMRALPNRRLHIGSWLGGARHMQRLSRLLGEGSDVDHSCRVHHLCTPHT